MGYQMDLSAYYFRSRKLDIGQRRVNRTVNDGCFKRRTVSSSLLKPLILPHLRIFRIDITSLFRTLPPHFHLNPSLSIYLSLSLSHTHACFFFDNLKSSSFYSLPFNLFQVFFFFSSPHSFFPSFPKSWNFYTRIDHV